MGAAFATEEISLAGFQRIEWREGIFALRMAKDCLHHGSLRVLRSSPAGVSFPQFRETESYRDKILEYVE